MKKATGCIVGNEGTSNFMEVQYQIAEVTFQLFFVFIIVIDWISSGLDCWRDKASNVKSSRVLRNHNDHFIDKKMN